MPETRRIKLLTTVEYKPDGQTAARVSREEGELENPGQAIDALAAGIASIYVKAIRNGLVKESDALDSLKQVHLVMQRAIIGF